MLIMKNLFPTILKFVFAGLIVAAVLIFSGLIPKPADPLEEGEISGNVTIWGTFPEGEMSLILVKFFPRNVEYIEKEESRFDEALVEAIAARRGPDLILIPQELILKRKSSIYTIPFTSYQELLFKTTFLRQGEIFLTPNGILAFPFYIDPMVMYWNRNMYAQAGIVRPPAYWSEVVELVTILTKQKDDGAILQSAIGLGEYRNITHAKDIIAMLILQTGNPIVRLTSQGATPTFNGFPSLGIPPVDDPIRFYTNFSNPRFEEYYTWNRGLPESRQMFLNQKLATYFGYASEYAEIKRKNPLLDFAVAKVPQLKGRPSEATFGRIFGVAILASSDNLKSAFRVALTLSSREFSSALSEATFLPPVRRDLYQERPTDAVRSVFYRSAIISLGWRDPNPEATDRIFREAIESIISGKLNVSEAIGLMESEFQLLLKDTLSFFYN